MKLLHIDSSIMSDKSVSRGLTAEIVDHYKTLNPTLEVTHYDLDAKPIAYLSSASFTDEAEQAEGTRIMNDFLEADVVVIGAPMYNFAVPAQLKAWIDRIAVAGKTFRYTETGSEGLVNGKTIIIASSRGGIYSGEMSSMDHQENYLKGVFGFLGVEQNDIRIVRAEGVSLGPDAAAEAVASAKAAIPTLQ